jgi:hypothetical protein
VTIDNAAGQARAVSLAPSVIQINQVQGAPGSPIPVTINVSSGTAAFAAVVSGIPGATLSATAGTAPATINLNLNLAALTQGVYFGFVGVRMTSAANLYEVAPITVTVGPPPTVNAISVTPNTGSGTAQTFTLAYSDSAGVTSDLTQAQVRFTNNAAGTTCVIHYRATTATVRMQDDGGAWSPFVPFGNGTLANSRCSLNLVTSSATPSGTDLAMALDLTFLSAFAGPTTIAMRAGSRAGPNTGWVTRGTYTVGAVLGATSVTPSSGSGMSGTFTATFSDSLGVTTDLRMAQVRVGAANSGACVVQYNAITSRVRLLDDAGTPGMYTDFGSGTLSNSQCALDLAQSSAAPSGTDLTMTLRLTFTSTFLGVQPVSLRATSNFGTTTTGIVPRGTWTVGATLQAVSISPNTGHGATQVFVLTYTDSEGVTTDLRGAKVRFVATNARCIIDYNAVAGRIRMQDDGGMWGTAVPLGSGTLSNSTCTLDLTQSTATPGGTTLTLSLHLTFSGSFTATVSMRADSNAVGTGAWIPRGTWTTP